MPISCFELLLTNNDVRESPPKIADYLRYLVVCMKKYKIKGEISYRRLPTNPVFGSPLNVKKVVSNQSLFHQNLLGEFSTRVEASISDAVCKKWLTNE